MMETRDQLIREVNEFARQRGQEPFVVLQESKLPVSHGKERDEPKSDSVDAAFARLGLTRDSYPIPNRKAAGREMHETRKDAVVQNAPLPEGIHVQMAEAIDGRSLPSEVRAKLADGSIHLRLAKAL